MLKRIKKGVILAAGDGDRLGTLTDTCPKVLLSVDGEGPLIRYPIEALVASGIEQIAIVVGYLADSIKELLGDGRRFGAELHYISNLDYLGGLAVSVHKVKNWANGEPVVLCMGDHIIDKELVRRLLYHETAEDTLCVDYTPSQSINLDEATRVALDNDGCIKDIGKNLTRWDAVDTGVFLLTPHFFDILDELINRDGNGVEMNDAIRFFISRGNCFHTRDVSGCFWMDVDTEEDLKVARS
ncbi:MAG: sugar phosphate nucleotidyltransferase [Dehalococcoidales bacterium]